MTVLLSFEIEYMNCDLIFLQIKRMFVSGSCQIEYSRFGGVIHMRCICWAETPENHYGFTVAADIRRSDVELFNFLFRSFLIFRCLEKYIETHERDPGEAASEFLLFCERAFSPFDIEYHWTG